MLVAGRRGFPTKAALRLYAAHAGLRSATMHRCWPTADRRRPATPRPSRFLRGPPPDRPQVDRGKSFIVSPLLEPHGRKFWRAINLVRLKYFGPLQHHECALPAPARPRIVAWNISRCHSMNEKRRDQISVPVDAALRAALEQAAARAQRTLSAQVRYIVIQALEAQTQGAAA